MPFLGGGHGQSETAITAWERVLRPLDFKRLIELGTFNGNFSVYFALWCERRNASFYTYDNQDWRTQEHWSWEPDEHHESFRARYLDGHFVQMDVLSKEAFERIGRLVELAGTSVVFCDNGKKTDEFLGLAPYLKTGDLIAVHDWDSEVHQSAIDRAEKENDIVLDLIDKDETAPQTAFFVRVK